MKKYIILFGLFLTTTCFADFPGWTEHKENGFFFSMCKNNNGTIILTQQLKDSLTKIDENFQWRSYLMKFPSTGLAGTLYVSPQGRVFYYAEKYLYEVKDTILGIRYASADSLYPNYIRQISGLTGDIKGNIWFADGYDQQENKIIKFDGQKWESYSLPYEQGEDIFHITCLATDSIGNIWVGTFMNGLYKFDGITWKRYGNSTGDLPTNSISRIAVSPKGVLWIGTNQGLCLYANDKFQMFTEFNSGLEYPLVDALQIDNQERVWVASYTGNVSDKNSKIALFMYDQLHKTWAKWDENNSLIPPNQKGNWVSRIFDICINRLGKILITFSGHFNGGLLIYDPSVVSVSEPPVLSEDVEIFPNPVTSRLQVRSGRAGIRAEVLTLLGQSVGFAESASESVEFSTESLPTGAYFVRVWSGGKMTTKAFQVSK